MAFTDEDKASIRELKNSLGLRPLEEKEAIQELKNAFKVKDKNASKIKLEIEKDDSDISLLKELFNTSSKENITDIINNDIPTVITIEQDLEDYDDLVDEIVEKVIEESFNMEYLGVHNSPPKKAKKNSLYRNDNQGIVYILRNDKWETFLKDGQQETNYIGGGLGDRDVIQLIQKYSVSSWNNLTDKPTNVSGFGITDVYTKSEVDEHTEDLIIHVTQEDRDRWDNPETVSTWDELQGKPTTVSGFGITDVYTKTEVDDLIVGVVAGELEWNLIQNKPTTVSGYAIEDVYTKSEIDSIVDDITFTYVDWDIVQNTPTLVSGYGITDVYTKSEVDAHTNDLIIHVTQEDRDRWDNTISSQIYYVGVSGDTSIVLEHNLGTEDYEVSYVDVESKTTLYLVSKLEENTLTIEGLSPLNIDGQIKVVIKKLSSNGSGGGSFDGYIDATNVNVEQTSLVTTSGSDAQTLFESIDYKIATKVLFGEYKTVDMEEVGDLIYVGFEALDGRWYFKKVITEPNGDLSILYTNNFANSSSYDYDQAWVNRYSLNYVTISMLGM